MIMSDWMSTSKRHSAQCFNQLKLLQHRDSEACNFKKMYVTKKIVALCIHWHSALVINLSDFRYCVDSVYFRDFSFDRNVSVISFIKAINWFRMFVLFTWTKKKSNTHFFSRKKNGVKESKRFEGKMVLFDTRENNPRSRLKQWNFGFIKQTTSKYVQCVRRVA